MNKQNKILLGVLALIVACTIGYALFSESITINGTASASANFDIEATCVTTVSAEVKAYAGMTDEYVSEAGYGDVACNVSENSVTLGATLDYPSARKYILVKLTNNSNMTAVTRDNAIEISNTDVNRVYEKGTDRLLNTYQNSSKNVQAVWGDNFYFEKADNTIITGYDEHFTDFLAGDGTITLRPNESWYIIYTLEWNEDTANNVLLTQEDFKTKYIAQEFTTTFRWTQSTQ